MIITTKDQPNQSTAEIDAINGRLGSISILVDPALVGLGILAAVGLERVLVLHLPPQVGFGLADLLDHVPGDLALVRPVVPLAHLLRFQDLPLDHLRQVLLPHDCPLELRHRLRAHGRCCSLCFSAVDRARDGWHLEEEGGREGFVVSRGERWRG